jgi:hypothetical protein
MPLQPLGDRQKIYVKHVDDCRKNYPEKSNMCDVYEYDRILMNQRQPQSMQNYTTDAFKKMKAPDHIVQLITSFWETNKLNQVKERWPDGNTYTNSWEASTYMVSVDDTKLRGSGSQLKRKLWSETQDILEEWTNEDLEPTSLYGIRVYTNNSILLPHVDRLPLVSSAMVCVAKDVDEDWPVEIYDHQGVAHNVTLDPGDMLLFESHSILHGRPFPMRGRFYAMLFIHFEPTGHSIRHGHGGETPDVQEQYKQASKDGVGGQSASNDGLPPYIMRYSPEEAHWKKQHPEGWHRKPAHSPTSVKSDGQEVQRAAAEGDVKTLEEELSKGKKDDVVNKRDENGWQPAHEAARGGHKETLELLVKNGADVNARTFGGDGETPLHIAKTRLGPFHPVVEYLQSLGALDVGSSQRSEL